MRSILPSAKSGLVVVRNRSRYALLPGIRLARSQQKNFFMQGTTLSCRFEGFSTKLDLFGLVSGNSLPCRGRGPSVHRDGWRFPCHKALLLTAPSAATKTMAEIYLTSFLTWSHPATDVRSRRLSHSYSYWWSKDSKAMQLGNLLVERKCIT